jgi:hypothetical protein
MNPFFLLNARAVFIIPAATPGSRSASSNCSASAFSKETIFSELRSQGYDPDNFEMTLHSSSPQAGMIFLRR